MKVQRRFFSCRCCHCLPC